MVIPYVWAHHDLVTFVSDMYSMPEPLRKAVLKVTKYLQYNDQVERDVGYLSHHNNVDKKLKTGLIATEITRAYARCREDALGVVHQANFTGEYSVDLVFNQELPTNTTSEKQVIVPFAVWEQAETKPWHTKNSASLRVRCQRIENYRICSQQARHWVYPMMLGVIIDPSTMSVHAYFESPANPGCVCDVELYRETPDDRARRPAACAATIC